MLRVALFALSILYSPATVEGHGYLTSPRSRNFYAHDIIGTTECVGSAGCPPPEYCQHCLNTNAGVCGKSTTLNYETSSWLDKNGNPMPWRSQAGAGLAQGGEYVEGGTIVLNSYLDTHHNGHMEIRACVMDDNNPAKCTTPEEFMGNELHFLQDLALGGHPPMPADPTYPERGMYAGGQGGSTKSFSFLFRLPEGVSGEKVLLQWKYITANSCSPPGYAAYFAAHPDLPSTYWTPGLAQCTLPYPNSGARSTTWPEQFFNCAEVTIKPTVTCAEATSFAVPGQIEAEQYCDQFGVKLEDSSEGTKNLAFLNPGDWTEYNINVASSEQYKFEARVASAYTTGMLDIKIDGTKLATLTIPNTNGWQTFNTLEATMNLSAGTHRLRLEFPSAGFNLNWVKFTPSDSLNPTPHPTNVPTKKSTTKPTNPPTILQPTNKPNTALPTSNPTPQPTKMPTSTTTPTTKPTNAPTTLKPTNKPTTALPTPNPTPQPTKMPTSATTAKPTTSGGTVCCADRNTGYQQCRADAWCQQSAANCSSCGGLMTSVPLQRTGCCSWGGQDCSSINPSTNPGCQYLQSDCQGSCGGVWKPTSATTAKPTTSGGTVCCADRNTGYQQCRADAWCQQSATNCSSCGGLMTSVPLQRTGCCSWGGQDCSGINPSTNPGCQYLQSDCQGSCGGVWKPF